MECGKGFILEKLTDYYLCIVKASKAANLHSPIFELQSFKPCNLILKMVILPAKRALKNVLIVSILIAVEPLLIQKMYFILKICNEFPTEELY